jgi:hypothetical protein
MNVREMAATIREFSEFGQILGLEITVINHHVI